MSKRAKLEQPIKQQINNKASNNTSMVGLKNSMQVEFRHAQAPVVKQKIKRNHLDQIGKTVHIPIMTNPNHSIRPVDKKFFE